MSYTAIVSTIHTRPHPGADRLKLGTVIGGFQVVVGLDTDDGALGIFFPTDGQLSHDYCRHNHLYTQSAAEARGTGASTFGFIDAKRRVRSQRFRGEISDGLWMPLSSLWWAGDVTHLTHGDTLTELHGHSICNRYETPATRRAMKGQPKTSRRHVAHFPEHVDTKQLRYFIDTIPDDAVVYVTEKLHGTSGRYGRVLVEEPLPAWKAAINRLCRRTLFTPAARYEYLNGTRRVILGPQSDAGYYGTHDFRYAATEGIELHMGEILYFELVGYVKPGEPIMAPQTVKKGAGLGKAFEQAWPSPMVYSYGCADGECALYVYRITQTGPDGATVELSWPQVKARCKRLGLRYVPDMAQAFGYETRQTPEDITAMAGGGASTLCSGHLREGVVLRIEHATGTTFLKSKSFEFGVLEGYLKADDAYIDTEEAQDGTEAA